MTNKGKLLKKTYLELSFVYVPWIIFCFELTLGFRHAWIKIDFSSQYCVQK